MNYYYTIENSNFIPSPERTPGTYSKYSSIDDKLDDLHYYTTYIKFGMGRATYDSSQEIRNEEINRDYNRRINNILGTDRRYAIGDSVHPDAVRWEQRQTASADEGYHYISYF